jgi:hypothetical protein
VVRTGSIALGRYFLCCRLVTSWKVLVLMVRALIRVLLIGLGLLLAACTSTSKGTPLAAPPAASASGATTAAGSTKAADKPSSPTTSAGAGADKSVGKAQTVKDGKDSAVITLVSMRTSTKGEDGIAPKSGNYVIFTLKIEGKAGSISTNSLYAQLKTPDGKFVDGMVGNGFLNTVEPDLPLQDIGPGETVEGTVVLDTPLPPGSKLVWLDPLDKPLAEWAL